MCESSVTTSQTTSLWAKAGLSPLPTLSNYRWSVRQTPILWDTAEPVQPGSKAGDGLYTAAILAATGHIEPIYPASGTAQLCDLGCFCSNVVFSLGDDRHLHCKLAILIRCDRNAANQMTSGLRECHDHLWSPGASDGNDPALRSQSSRSYASCRPQEFLAVRCRNARSSSALDLLAARRFVHPVISMRGSRELSPAFQILLDLLAVLSMVCSSPQVAPPPAASLSIRINAIS